MPRRRTLTGRSARQRRRNNSLPLNRNVILRDNSLSVDRNVILKDAFKCARNVIPKTFLSYDCGLMDLKCRFCNAKHFESEVTLGDRTAFTSCCHKGKAILPPLSQNEYFKSLYDGLTSNEPAIKSKSKKYFENIRKYNSCFAMVSSEAKVTEAVTSGVYHFKIHDIFYHRSGPMTAAYGRSPCYAQLYFYDVDTAINYRLQKRFNQTCNINIMREISLELERSNPFVRSFIAMKDHCQRVENQNKDICMLIKLNHDLDLRRFNDAIQTDVAVIFSTVDGEPPFERNMICFSKVNGIIKNISVLDSSLDPLAYPLLFPNGDTGWHVNIAHNAPTTSNSRAPRNKLTMLQYAAYRLAIRDDFSMLHHSQKLFLQWIVDMYVRIEGSRLHFIRQNQTILRSEVYNNLTDYVELNMNARTVGRRVILPSSFNGSPRNMYQNYLDAMSIVQHFGKPSLFITMTCNPSWHEIVNNIGVGEAANFRPDITVRVFKSKLKALIEGLIQNNIFGKVAALIYTIEFQKRGLPHAHILLTLDDQDKIVNAIDIDKVVSAEIPDIKTHPTLHKYVVKHMMHGPCGVLNPKSVCMRDGKCIKEYPKQFNETTCESLNGYPLYRRRDNGIHAEVRGSSLDNRYVVPYNPYLLAKFNCHINVEVCTTVKSVKYIYKYVYKGYDSVSVELESGVNEQDQNIEINEVTNFLIGRYVGSTEAIWRIYELPIHFQSHVIIRLDIHLPRRQNVYFREGQERQVIDKVRQTKLLAYFELNRSDPSAREYKYIEIPMHYVWEDSRKKWKKRSRGGNKIITRMYVVSPKDIELFHLRLLLLHVCGPKSFEDVRTYNNFLYPSFVEACHARGIASNDNEWRECLNETKELQSPKQMRNLFGYICAINVPANALALWNEFKVYLSEDFLRLYSEEISFNRALLEIDDILNVHNLSCQILGLPDPTYSQRIEEEYTIDVIEQEMLFCKYYETANIEQRNLIDQVIREILYHDTGSNVFCLTAHAGCGKTFTQTAIIHKLNSLNLRCIPTAFSGIASTLLPGGRTLHNVFKLPIPILENSVPNITANSSYGSFINSSSLIIIDEVSMCPLQVLKIIDRLLRDLCDENDRLKAFGGKTILLCGDFRQILPVIPHGSRGTVIENCVTSWHEFPNFHKVTFTRNMRALPNEIEFVEFLKKIGNDEVPQFPQFGENVIKIPQQLIGDNSNIIDEVYGNISENILSENILNSVILAPTNDDCTLINTDILNQIPGEQRTYHSYDKIICDNDNDINNYPVEFLNSLTISGLPPHKLVLKVNCVVLLIRNLNTKDALVNGTRMRIKFMHRNSIDCEVLTGTARSKRILIPRINLTYSGTILPFKFQRTQFPIINAFAMTINKSQGQTFQKIGVLLNRPVFTHGQLYVAASRVRSFDGLRFYISEYNGQGHLANDERIFTKNIVFREVLNL